MGRLLARSFWLLSIYLAIALAVVVAGFLGGAIGIWATVLWSAAVIVAFVLVMRRRADGARGGREDLR